MNDYDDVLSASVFPAWQRHPLATLPQELLDVARLALADMADLDLDDPEERAAAADGMISRLHNAGWLRSGPIYQLRAERQLVGDTWQVVGYRIVDASMWPDEPDVTRELFGAPYVSGEAGAWAVNRLNAGRPASTRYWLEHQTEQGDKPPVLDRAPWEVDEMGLTHRERWQMDREQQARRNA